MKFAALILSAVMWVTQVPMLKVKTIYGGVSVHGCPPIGHQCVRDPDLTIHNNTGQDVLVVYHGRHITVRRFTYMEVSQ